MKKVDLFKKSAKMVKLVTIDQIANKAKSYNDYNEFYSDVLWFSHACHATQSSNIKIEHANKQMCKFLEEEISSMKDCPECYENAYLFSDVGFVKTCQKKHEVIWAKSNDYDLLAVQINAFI